MALQLNTRTVNGVTVLRCSGRIRFGEETAELREKVKELLTETQQIVLNLAEVHYIDSNGLGTLAGLYTTAKKLGAEIKLANLTQRIKDALQITRLGTVFELYDAEDKAIAAFRKDAA